MSATNEIKGGVTEITLTANIYREDDDYVAQCMEIGTVGQGSTAEEAVNDLCEATELLLEECADLISNRQGGESSTDFIAGVRKLEQAYADYIGEPVEPVVISFAGTVTFSLTTTYDWQGRALSHDTGYNPTKAATNQQPPLTLTMQTTNPDIERELEAAIDPWLAHMTWRADYAAWRQKRLHLEDYQQPYLRDINAHAAAQLTGTVLDVGAGMGGLVVALAQQGVRVVAQEYNPAYCQIIKLRARRYGLNMAVVNSAGEALPFAAASFQLITAWDVLEHVQDMPATLRELRRILVPGGRAIVTITNRFGFRDPHYHLAVVNWLPRPLAEWYISRKGRNKQGNFQDKQRLSEMHYYTYAAFAREAQRAGFHATDVAEARVMHGKAGGGKARRVLPALRRFHLAQPLYRVHRFFFQGTHTVLLRRSDE